MTDAEYRECLEVLLAPRPVIVLGEPYEWGKSNARWGTAEEAVEAGLADMNWYIRQKGGNPDPSW